MKKTIPPSKKYTIIDLFETSGGIFGFYVGFKAGSSLFDNLIVAIIMAIVHMYLFYIICKIPFVIFIKLYSRKLARENIDKLYERLKKTPAMAHLIIAHLGCRGADIDCLKPYMLSLLSSGDADRRMIGWRNLYLWFPEDFTKLGDYHPHEKHALCLEKIQRVFGIPQNSEFPPEGVNRRDDGSNSESGESMNELHGGA